MKVSMKRREKRRRRREGKRKTKKLGELRTLLVLFHSDLVQRNVEFLLFSNFHFKLVAFADFNGLLAASTLPLSVPLTQQ